MRAAFRGNPVERRAFELSTGAAAFGIRALWARVTVAGFVRSPAGRLQAGLLQSGEWTSARRFEP